MLNKLSLGDELGGMLVMKAGPQIPLDDIIFAQLAFPLYDVIDAHFGSN